MITHCVSPEDTIILAADVKAEIRVSLKLLALKVNLQPQGYSFTLNEIPQEAALSKVA